MHTLCLWKTTLYNFYLVHIYHTTDINTVFSDRSIYYYAIECGPVLCQRIGSMTVPFTMQCLYEAILLCRLLIKRPPHWEMCILTFCICLYFYFSQKLYQNIIFMFLTISTATAMLYLTLENVKQI